MHPLLQSIWEINKFFATKNFKFSYKICKQMGATAFEIQKNNCMKMF